MVVGQMVVRKPRGKIQIWFEIPMIPVVCVGLTLLHQIEDPCEYLLSNIAFLTLQFIRSLEHKVELIDRLIHPERPECAAQTCFALKRPHWLGGRGVNQPKITNVVAVIRDESNLKWNPIRQLRKICCNLETFSDLRNYQQSLFKPLEISERLTQACEILPPLLARRFELEPIRGS